MRCSNHYQRLLYYIYLSFFVSVCTHSHRTCCTPRNSIPVDTNTLVYPTYIRPLSKSWVSTGAAVGSFPFHKSWISTGTAVGPFSYHTGPSSRSIKLHTPLKDNSHSCTGLFHINPLACDTKSPLTSDLVRRSAKLSLPHLVKD
jgi:hypothetical protein